MSRNGSLHLLSPAGFRAAGVAAGIKQSGKSDLALLVADTPCTAAAVFTTNRVAAAPVYVGRANVTRGRLRAIVVNSGNANACTGDQGLHDARRMCEVAGETVGAEPRHVLPSSTGIIGHRLPMDKVEPGIRQASTALGDTTEHALAFSDAIQTTDLVRKAAAESFTIGRRRVTIAGVCKGSGMIGPSMSAAGPPPAPAVLHATMLAYMTTDATITAAMLRRTLAYATARSFNAVTVDAHTSTNDTAAVLASGRGPAVDSLTKWRAFSEAFTAVCESLAYQIAADGEGATKVVIVRVEGARRESDARHIARAIADSPLVKCALHGNDPNWGRVVSAAGLAGVPFDPLRATLTLAGVKVFDQGHPVAFDPPAASAALDKAEVDIRLTCALGDAAATVYTCDLSKQYVTINADYHT